MASCCGASGSKDSPGNRLLAGCRYTADELSRSGSRYLGRYDYAEVFLDESALEREEAVAEAK
ncbi:hypothetical protein ColTof3_01987 [Colletotrichum tofieldiae]|nr:hypothetical protein ColTof3_01987 [Colletotrichum tofieldiae]